MSCNATCQERTDALVAERDHAVAERDFARADNKRLIEANRDLGQRLERGIAFAQEVIAERDAARAGCGLCNEVDGHMRCNGKCLRAA